jgi:hypothetical protein
MQPQVEAEAPVQLEITKAAAEAGQEEQVVL